jgi:C-terminal processing protease CtpA/Prc
MSDYKAVFQPWVYDFVRVERLRAAEPYVVGFALFAAFALAFVGVLGNHGPNLQRHLWSSVEQPVRRTENLASQKLELQIAILQQRFEGEFTALQKEIEAADLSIAHHDSLIAAINARLAQQDASIEGRLHQQQADMNAELDEEKATLNARLDQQASLVSAQPHVQKKESNKTLPTQRSDKRPKGTPHLGVGVTKEIGEGLVVGEVDPGSPAERAGLRQLDVLLKVDGIAVNNTGQMSEALLSLKGRHSVRLTLQRAGKTQHVRLILG